MKNLNYDLSIHYLHFNPYHAGQILPIHHVPSITKVTLFHFIHTLLSITKVSATIVLQKFCDFACIFNIVKLIETVKFGIKI